MLSLVCEAFGCPPLVALEQPAGLTMAILQLRAYAGAKVTMETARSDAELPDTPLISRVIEIQKELLAEAKAERDAKRTTGNNRP